MVNKKIVLSMLTIVTVACLVAGTLAGFARVSEPIDGNALTSAHLTFTTDGTLLMNADNENLLVPGADPLASTPITITNDDDSIEIQGITLGLSDIAGDLADYVTVDSVQIGDQEVDVGSSLVDLDGENTIVISLDTPLSPSDATDLVFNCHLDADVDPTNEDLQDAQVTFSTTITGYQLADDLP